MLWAILLISVVGRVFGESVSDAKWSVNAKINADCDVSLHDVLCAPCDRYELVFENDANGNTISGDKTELMNRLGNGGELRLSLAYPNGPWMFNPPNVHVYQGYGEVFAQQNSHISLDTLTDGDSDFMQDNAYYYITVHSTTGQEHVVRYRIGGAYVSETKRRWPMKWFVMGGEAPSVPPANVRVNEAGGYLRIDYMDFPYNDVDSNFAVTNNFDAVAKGKRATETKREVKGFVVSPFTHVWMKSTFKNLEMDSERFNYIWVEDPLDWEVHVGVYYAANTILTRTDIGFEQMLNALKNNRYNTNIACYKTGNVAEFKDPELVMESSSTLAVAITVKYIGN